MWPVSWVLEVVCLFWALGCVEGEVGIVVFGGFEVFEVFFESWVS